MRVCSLQAGHMWRAALMARASKTPHMAQCQRTLHKSASGTSLPRSSTVGVFLHSIFRRPGLTCLFFLLPALVGNTQPYESYTTMGIGTTENAGQDINEFRPRLEFMAFTFAAQMWQAQVSVYWVVERVDSLLTHTSFSVGVDWVGLVHHGCLRRRAGPWAEVVRVRV
jgi:hypothetical protein